MLNGIGMYSVAAVGCRNKGTFGVELQTPNILTVLHEHLVSLKRVLEGKIE
jgi:hypothetical protein